ncbi:MAG: glycerophosphodiester phosphodiesterase [Candidatus Dojkabacteria bacterium]|nr:glycerophosphodiester phosphodiesterase [Candidatus Dojkabacteria bacterium]MDQ7021195.1 glycerophosphodiester phosphodiesterase [Candidatus Dojkabacteria bacterium]
MTVNEFKKIIQNKKDSNQIPTIAHRGNSGEFNDNSLEGLISASKSNADGVEFDVRKTKDNYLIVFHNNAVEINGKTEWVRNIE